MQLSSVLSRLSDFQNSNRRLVESKLKEHLRKVKQIVQEYEVTVTKRCKQTFELQSAGMVQAESTITELLDSLQNDEISLQALETHDPDLLVYMLQTVDQLYNKTVEF